MVDRKTGLVGHPVEGLIERFFKMVGDTEVLHPATTSADQMVVVVASEVFSKLKTSELVVGDNAAHHTGLLKQTEVAVHRRLGEPT